MRFGYERLGGIVREQQDRAHADERNLDEVLRVLPYWPLALPAEIERPANAY